MPEPLMAVRPAAAYADPDGQLGPIVQECLTAAVAAPSIHNTQPWLFHLRRGGIDVYADRGRQLGVVDPHGRELMLSVGAAIFNLRVAMLARGRMPVQRLLPESNAGNLVARITPGQSGPPSETARALAWAIPRRHTNRWPFTELALPRDILHEMIAACAAEGATLRVADPVRRRTIVGLVRAAEQHWGENPAYRDELADWTANRSGRRDGIPAGAFGPQSAPKGLPVRDLGLSQPSAARRVATFEARPTLAVLYSEDSLAQWIRAGQALQRTLLTATVRGVATTLMTQPLEIPRLRALLSDPSSGHPAQAILRIGYARHPGTATPRRAIGEVLLDLDHTGLDHTGLNHTGINHTGLTNTGGG